MALKKFTTPVDTRLITHANGLFKLKVLFDGTCEVPDSYDSEVEQVIRRILHKDNRDYVNTIQTKHFLFDVKVVKWKAVKYLQFKMKDKQLNAYPKEIHITVKMKEVRKDNPTATMNTKSATSQQAVSGYEQSADILESEPGTSGLNKSAQVNPVKRKRRKSQSSIDSSADYIPMKIVKPNIPNVQTIVSEELAGESSHSENNYNANNSNNITANTNNNTKVDRLAEYSTVDLEILKSLPCLQPVVYLDKMVDNAGLGKKSNQVYNSEQDRGRMGSKSSHNSGKIQQNESAMPSYRTCRMADSLGQLKSTKTACVHRNINNVKHFSEVNNVTRMTSADRRLNSAPNITSTRAKRYLYPAVWSSDGNRYTSPEPRNVLAYTRDRTLIRQDELAEEMRLMQMNKSSPEIAQMILRGKGGQ